jgi:hypothetical protein
LYFIIYWVLTYWLHGAAFTSACHLSLSWAYQWINPGLNHQFVFHNMICLYGKELFAPHPTPELEYYPLSAVHDCLFNIFAATLRIGGHSIICNLRMCHAVVIGTHLSWLYCILWWISYKNWFRKYSQYV